MFSVVSRTLLALSALATLVASAPSAHNLPIFFFHGINGNAGQGNTLKANLSSDARPFVALNFCEGICTLNNMNTQAEMAIKQIRGIVANDTRFDNGYLFVAHSLGGAVARAVIETMDDHKVHSLFSLAGAQNGLAYGTQASDVVPAQNFLKYYAPVFYSSSIFDPSKYTVADIQSGKLTIDLATVLQNHPELQVTSGVQFARSPVESEWIKYNTFYAPLNNLQAPTTDAIKAEQARRKKNFLKLQAAHFFGSSYDETISPWQSALLARYSTFSSLDEFAAKFKEQTIVPMTGTTEYTQDTYGLQTLDKRGGIFLHPFDNVPHSAWIADATSPRDGQKYAFQPIYETGLYPLIAPDGSSPTPEPTTGKPLPHC